jgi:hypothetical protein
MDEINLSTIPSNYSYIIKKIKNNRLFIKYLKNNNSKFDICTTCEKEIIEMFKQYMIYNNINNLPNSKLNLENAVDINNEIILKNYTKADKYIKSMLKPQELIILNGKINNIPMKILVNTGSTYNFIYKNKLLGSKLEKLIDTNVKNQDITKKVDGSIWFYNIEIELKKNKDYYEYITLQINLIVLSDNNTKTKDIEFDMILGMSFMKYYNVIINFNNKTLQINDDIKINF